MIDVEMDIYSDSLALRALQDGGFTFDCNSGSYATTGFAVACNPGVEMLHIGPTLSPGFILAYLRNHRELLEQSGAHIGAWATTGPFGDARWFLDVATVVQDRDAAIALGRKHNQLAIFDLAKGEEIRL